MSEFAKAETVRILRQRIENVAAPACEKKWATVRSGLNALDQALPRGGFRRGSIVEWVGEETAGTGTLALLSARSVCREEGHLPKRLVIVDDFGDLYPPVIPQFFSSIGSVVLIRTKSNGPRMSREAIWAMEESLRCPAVGAVWARIGFDLPDQTWRRLTLAAESGGSVGMFVRPENAMQSTAWSDVRIAVEPRAMAGARFNLRRMKLSLLRCRGSFPGINFEVLFDVATFGMSAAELADSAYSTRLA